MSGLPEERSGPHEHRWAEPVDRQEKAAFLDDSSNVRKLLWAFTVLGALLLAADLVFHRHAIDPWEAVVGFYPVVGFASIVALVYGARGLRKLVRRPEDYYEDGGD